MSAAYNINPEKEELNNVNLEQSHKLIDRKPTEKELADCRPCRICLVGFFVILLIGLLVSSIVLIATTDKCSKKEKEKEKPVVYQIYVKSFKDTDGNGYGDLNGVRSKLDYIKKLGVGVIVLNDVISQKDFALSENVGNLVDFDALIKACKEKKIRVLLQLNPVVVSASNEWFLESKNGTAKRNWFIWRAVNKTNNWITANNSSAWHKSDSSQNESFYSHFGKDLPTLNYYSQEVIDEIKSKLVLWLDKGASGFLFLGVSRLAVGENFRNNTGSSIYDKDTVHGHGILNILYKTIKSKDGILYVVPRTNAIAAVRYFGTKEYREADVVVNDDLALLDNSVIDAVRLNETICAYTSATTKFGSIGWMVGGTNYNRLASRFQDTTQAKLLSLFLLTLPHAVLPYYGDEVLLEDTNGKSYSIMKWNNMIGGGFSNGSVSPWLPLSSAHNPILNYANLSRILASLDAFSHTPKVLYAKDQALVMLYRDEYMVAVNFASVSVNVNNVIDAQNAKYLFSTSNSLMNKEVKNFKDFDILSKQLFVLQLSKK